MKQPKWILDSVVYAIHNALLAEHGGASGIRDITLLESALSRPKNVFAYNKDATVFDLAAAYSFGIAKNHPFVDGNKRVALTIGAIFLEVNGFTLAAPEEDTVITFLGLASGDIDEETLSRWYKDNSAKS